MHTRVLLLQNTYHGIVYILRRQDSNVNRCKCQYIALLESRVLFVTFFLYVMAGCVCEELKC